MSLTKRKINRLPITNSTIDLYLISNQQAKRLNYNFLFFEFFLVEIKNKKYVLQIKCPPNQTLSDILL